MLTRDDDKVIEEGKSEVLHVGDNDATPMRQTIDVPKSGFRFCSATCWLCTDHQGKRERPA